MMGDYPRFLDALPVAGMSFCLEPPASGTAQVQSTDSNGRTKRYPSAFTGPTTRREAEVGGDIRQLTELTAPEQRGILNVLEWIWIDKLIDLPRQMPKAPNVSVLRLARDVAPFPPASFQSSTDEYVPLAKVQEMFDRAGQPEKFILIQAEDHRFEGRREDFFTRLKEALEWVTTIP